MILRKEEHKPRAHSFGLYAIAIKRLEKLPTSRTGIISFPNVFEEICRSFQLPKEQGWELLLILRDFGFLEIIRQKGIRVNKVCVLR